MQNSSFLFNYDSEDSSAHYSSSYQFNSLTQPENGGDDSGAKTPKVDTAAEQSNRQLSFSDDASGGTPPNNERDGGVSKRTDVTEVGLTAQAAGNTEVNDEEILPEDLRKELLLDQQDVLAVPEKSDQIDAHTVWKNALSELALQVSSATYDTWLRDTSVIAYEDGEFIIGLPNAYAQDWLTNRFMPKIKRVLVRLAGRSVHVTFRVVPTAVAGEQDHQTSPLYDTKLHNTKPHDMQLHETKFSESSSQPERQDTLLQSNPPIAGASSTTDEVSNKRSAPVSDENDMTQYSIPSDVGNNLGSRPVVIDNNFNLPPTNSGSYGGNYAQNGNYSGAHESSLQSGYTFDTFIVGSHNQLAHAAAASIADGPGHSFNPLFIYGGVGLGKTHLLHAVGNSAAARGSRVLYCTSEQFTNELISSIRGRGTEEFRSKYRQVDVLLIDDIQFIAGKESTQEEFFHTFNHLHNAGRQVVLSSDRPPRALATLEERLRSRFEGGLLTDISPPDFETRVAILQSKANKSSIRIHTDVLMLIAERVDSNIRELEGALNRMVVQARLFSGTLDIPLAESILRNLAPQRTPRSPQIVTQIVAEHFHLTEEDLLGRSRTKEIAHARQTAMYLLREENTMSLPSIGDLLGGRDHSTVRHGVEKITNDLEQDEQLRREIMTLREKIYSAPEMR